MAEALASLLSNPAQARRMGEAGRHRAESELSYDALAKRLAAPGRAPMKVPADQPPLALPGARYRAAGPVSCRKTVTARKVLA